MKPPTFVEGVMVATAASIAGGVLFAAMTAVFTGGNLLRLLIAGLGLAYVIYLLSRSSERVGRITALVSWLAAAAAVWLLAPSLPVYLLLHVGMIWVIRSIFFYSSVLSSLADLGLNGLSAAAAVWAGIQTGSAFLSIWCFFLTQALFVAIPWDMGGNKPKPARGAAAVDRFEQAHREAQAALRKFSSLH
jgi:hypothetical protein